MPTIITRESEQLSLFTLDGNAAQAVETAPGAKVIVPVVVPAAKTAPAPARKAVPDTKRTLRDVMSESEFQNVLQVIRAAEAYNDIKSLLDMLRIRHFNLNSPKTIWCYGNTHYVCWHCRGAAGQLIREQATWQDRDESVTFATSRNDTNPARDEYHHQMRLHVAYVSKETADCVFIPVDIELVEYLNHRGAGDITPGSVTAMKAATPFIPARLYDNVVFAQTEGQLHQIAGSRKPWLREWLAANPSYSLERCLAFPWLETLEKAGYRAVIRSAITDEWLGNNDMEMLNRLCGPGRKPKDIFKCTKAVYTVLKDERNISVWDTLRRLEKKEQITGDAIAMVYQMGLQPKDLEYVNRILSKKHHGRPLFTMTSLVNYLNRLDMYEAIPNREALPLLNDYLHMCNTLEMPPRTDGDSLKREHDIAARLCRERRDQIMEKKMKEREELEKRQIAEGNSKLARAAYRENVFFVRPITEYDDLLDEAIQQHNCVASYADRIAEGKSRIFTLRETAHPEKSLVTIELSPDCRTIRQKYLAGNQEIRNKAINDFITRWHKQLNAAS